MKWRVKYQVEEWREVLIEAPTSVAALAEFHRAVDHEVTRTRHIGDRQTINTFKQILPSSAYVEGQEDDDPTMVHVVKCMDGRIRHVDNPEGFTSRHDASLWANTGHACTREHTYEEWVVCSVDAIHAHNRYMDAMKGTKS